MKTLFLPTIFFAITLQLYAQTILLQGAGDATFFYDANPPGTCDAANGIQSAYSTINSYPMCEFFDPDPKTLGSYQTNNIVAIPNKYLGGNLAQYCGKKIIVTVDGNERTDLELVVWDGCQACNDNDGLDLSSTIFGELFGASRCVEGRISGEMSWEIVDQNLMEFNPGYSA